MNKVSLRNIIIVYISKLRDKIKKDLKGTINLKTIMGLDIEGYTSSISILTYPLQKKRGDGIYYV